MDFERLEQFKQESDILIKNTQWLIEEADKIFKEEEYYQDNPHLDTYDLMKKRLDKMDELQQRSNIQSKIDDEHRLKYKDWYDMDF